MWHACLSSLLPAARGPALRSRAVLPRRLLPTPPPAPLSFSSCLAQRLFDNLLESSQFSLHFASLPRACELVSPRACIRAERETLMRKILWAIFLFTLIRPVAVMVVVEGKEGLSS